jgi:hypothetical protein
MAEKRTIEQVRAEIQAQRSLLADDVAALRHDIRVILPFAAGTMAALALATKGRSLKLTFKLLLLARRFR